MKYPDYLDGHRELVGTYRTWEANLTDDAMRKLVAIGSPEQIAIAAILSHRNDLLVPADLSPERAAAYAAKAGNWHIFDQMQDYVESIIEYGTVDMMLEALDRYDLELTNEDATIAARTNRFDMIQAIVPKLGATSFQVYWPILLYGAIHDNINMIRYGASYPAIGEINLHLALTYANSPRTRRVIENEMQSR